ncbi:MAG: hypothetical protein R6V20_02510 [Desulfobia sp.]
MTAVKWFFFLLISIAAFIYILGLKPAEDTISLLPDGSRDQMELLKKMGLTSKVLISLQYQEKSPINQEQSWSALKESTREVGRLLEKSPLLTKLYYHVDQEKVLNLPERLRSRLPVLLDQADLREIEKRLSAPRLKEIIQEDFRKLNSLTGLALKKKIIQDPLDFSSLVLPELERLRGKMKVSLNDGYFTSDGKKSTLIWGESSKPLTNSKQAILVHKLIEETVQQGAKPGINARISGPLLHTLANSRAIKTDLKLLLPLATLTLFAFLLYSTGTVRIFAVATIPFLAAPPAIYILSQVHDRISIMALGFGIVLLGLSVDFAVHIFLHQADAGKAHLKTLKKPLLLAWITSVSCFAVLLLSSVPAHRQMALLAVTGISWALILAWQLVPDISRPFLPATSGHPHLQRGCSLPTVPARTRQKTILVSAWILLILSGLLVWPQLHYNGDLRTFDVADPEVEADEKFFQKRWGGGGKEMIFAAASASNLNQALNLNDQLYQTLLAHGVKEFQSVAPVLPGTARQKRNRENWQEFWEGRIQSFRKRLNRVTVQNGFAQGTFEPFLEKLADPVPLLEPSFILDQGLFPLFSSLIRKPGRIPDNGDKWLILTLIPENDKTGDLVNSFQEKNEGLTVLSNKSWRKEVENQLRREIHSLSLYAVLIITCLTVALFRSFRAIIAVLAPVASALAGIALFAFFSASGINLMHILMAIMVMGLSVDYGIFTVCNHRNYISPAISRAVTICAVSSLIGFGVLALASHPALQSLGITVLTGIGLSLPTALWISPIILGNHQKGSKYEDTS